MHAFSSPQICVKWDDVYARVGVTSSELIDLVEARGGGGISTSKMCISVLRPAATSCSAVGRRRSGEGAAGVQMEAVQIAGPEGIFEEWKVCGTRLSCVSLVVSGTTLVDIFCVI